MITWVLAQTTNEPTNVILEFVRLGPLGLVIWAMLGGWLWTKPSVEQLLASIKRLTDENVRKDDEIARLKAEVAVLRAQEAEKRR